MYRKIFIYDVLHSELQARAQSSIFFFFFFSVKQFTSHHYWTVSYPVSLKVGYFPIGVLLHLAALWKGIDPSIKTLDLVTYKCSITMRSLQLHWKAGPDTWTQYSRHDFNVLCHILCQSVSFSNEQGSNLKAWVVKGFGLICVAKTLFSAPVRAIFPLEFSTREEIPVVPPRALMGWPNHLRTTLNIELDYA